MRRRITAVFLAALMGISPMSASSVAALDMTSEEALLEETLNGADGTTEETPEVQQETDNDTFTDDGQDQEENQESAEPELPEQELPSPNPDDTFGQEQPETPDLPESGDDFSDTDVSVPDNETKLPGEDLIQQYSLQVESDHADIFFASDLEKLKKGTLTDPDTENVEDSVSDDTEISDIAAESELLPEEQEVEIDTQDEVQEETVSKIEAAKEILPEDVASLLTEDTYDLLIKQEHTYGANDIVSFYVIPDADYEVDMVTAISAYGDLEVMDYANGAYDVTMPDSDVTLTVTTKEETPETEAEIETEAENEAEDEEEETPAVSMSAVKAAATSQVKWTTKGVSEHVDAAYAFTPAFRAGKSQLVLEVLQGSNKLKVSGTDGNGVAWSGFNIKGLDWSDYNGKLRARYTNVGDVNGKPVDLIISIIGWDATSSKADPQIQFVNNNIQVFLRRVRGVRFMFYIVESGKGIDKTVDTKGHITFMDVDGSESLSLPGNWGKADSAYITSAGKTYLAPKADSNYMKFGGGNSGSNLEPSNSQTWVTVNFSKGSFGARYRYENYNGGSGRCAMYTEGRSVGNAYPLPNPGKRVGALNSSYANNMWHNSKDWSSNQKPYEVSPNTQYTYGIEQTLYPANERYTSFVVTDQLDKCLTYKSAKVLTASGQDMTSSFTIKCDSENKVTFTANSALLNRDESFNKVSYYFYITVAPKSKQTIISHNHVASGNHFEIENRARVTIKGGAYSTFDKYTNYSYVGGQFKGTYYVQKIDADNKAVLSGATFKLQERQANGTYKDLQYLTWDSKNKRYSTGELTWSTSNRGYFKIIETAAPSGYIGGWSQVINIGTDAMSNGKVLTAPNQKKKEEFGTIAITKKDSITGENILARDGEFKVYQWNKATGKYEDTLGDTGIVKYNKIRGYYLSNRLKITDDNLGKFKVVETKNPTGYEGTWEKTVEFKGGQDLEELELEAANVPIVPPTGVITVTKRIKEADIIWAHGNPTFRFKVSGTDIKGLSHTYEDFVEFQEGNYTKDGEYAVLSTTFTVPIGSYQVSEYKTLRYAFNGVSADTKNVTISGQNGVAVLTVDAPDAGVTFTNNKIKYDRYSHSDVIKNTVGIEW